MKLRPRWRASLIALAVGATAATLTAVAVSNANAATIEQGVYYNIVNRHSGKAIQIEGSSTAENAMVVQATRSSATSQQFRFEPSATGWWRIINRNSNKAINVVNGSTADGAEVRQATITSNQSMQFEVLHSDGDYLRFRNRISLKVLDLWEWNTADNARISQFGDLNGANQQWLLVVAGSAPSTSNPPPSNQTGLVGWATQNGGTTGGGSAATTTVSSASALTSALASTSASVIRVSGTISCSGMLRVRSNKTILGNSGATIVGCGFNINADNNVIIRNLTFRDWDDDAINVQESARNIWIDHNTFSNGFDGAVDIKRGSDFITVSWNRVFNHDKSMLLGHSDDNGSQDIGHLRVTYHHHFFDGSTQRHPRVRFGNPVHVYNNYYRANSGYGVASTEGAGVLVEGNYFENVSDPYHLGEGDSGPGTLVARNNTLVGSGAGQTGGSVASIPYSYSLDASANVKSIVTAGAGAGKITV
jgi:pectate lyase